MKIKMKKIREMSADDLKKQLAESKLQLAKERGQISIGGAPSNVGDVRNVRKTIARILTELKQRRVVTDSM